MAGLEITLSMFPDGSFNMSGVKAFMKDVGDSQRVSPTETIYAALPAFMYLDANITGVLLEPLLEYQSLSSYGNSISADDTGLTQTHGNVTNLALKGIIAIQAMAGISQIMGQTPDVQKYELKVAFSAIMEAASDKPIAFGFALSSDSNSNTRSDWTLFSAAAAPDIETRNLLISGVHKHVSPNLTNGTFPTLFNVLTGLGPGAGVSPNGFGSPAQGAMFSVLALNVANKTVIVPLPPASRSKTGAIAGGVVSGVVLLLLSGIVVVIFLRGRRHRQAADGLAAPRPYMTAVFGGSFMAPTNPSSNSLAVPPSRPPGAGSPFISPKAALMSRVPGHVVPEPTFPPASSQPPSSSMPCRTEALRSEMERLRHEVEQLCATQGQTFGDGIEHPLRKRAEASIEDRALAFIQAHLDVQADAVSFKCSCAGEVSDHVFVRQAIDGIPVANALTNVAFNKDDKLLRANQYAFSSFPGSFAHMSLANVAYSTPTVSLEDAIASAEQTIDRTFNEHPPTLEFLALEIGSVRLTHVMQIQNAETNAWLEAFFDAHTGDVLSLTDFVTKTSYLLLPTQKEILTPEFQISFTRRIRWVGAFPDGWHSDGTTTTANNAISFKGPQTATTAQSAAGLVFNYLQSAMTATTTTANINAARVNAFYIVNSYGFTEAAFNFQNNNFGNGGARSDRITISVQNSAGIDNADFSTPPDGQSGAMRMFLWDLTNPERDGALENDIVTYENTHRITNRMTGGRIDRCLKTTEAGGMGEGRWNEKTTSAVPDYVLGQDVINDPASIRSHPYSTSATVNPLRYSSLRTPTEVHVRFLHNVYAALVTAHGFSTTARTNPAGNEGNIVFLHLFIDALALQPCNHHFHLPTRTVIGANTCALLRAFASRGLGTAAANHVDSTTVPASNNPKHIAPPPLALPSSSSRISPFALFSLPFSASYTEALVSAAHARLQPSSKACTCASLPPRRASAFACVLARTTQTVSAGRLSVAGTLRHHRFANPRLARTPKRANVLMHTPGGPREDAHRRTRAQYALHPPPSLSEFYEDCQRATTFFQRV
ncbi:Fungalysin metallopeptidase-domain-containing protein [Mycena olivaceomarginata]|nr:Fungalysin metallopeptidase-domain-containing protein [Mycena olivaceomarginata]